MTTTERTTARIENFIRLLGETIRGELQQPKETTGGDYKRKPTATGQKNSFTGAVCGIQRKRTPTCFKEGDLKNSRTSAEA